MRLLKQRKVAWTGASSFVLELPLCNLYPSIINSVPCDWIVQRAYFPGWREFDFSGCYWGGEFGIIWEGWVEFDQFGLISWYKLRDFYHRNRSLNKSSRLQGPNFAFMTECFQQKGLQNSAVVGCKYISHFLRIFMKENKIHLFHYSFFAMFVPKWQH